MTLPSNDSDPLCYLQLEIAMTVSYWLNLGIRYTFVESFNRDKRIMDCVAPYCAIQLRVEVCNDLA